MTIDLFYKSYHKDFNLLYYSLASIKKNITGYNEIHIVVPNHERHLFDYRYMPERTIVHLEQEYGDGYLMQQYRKITAHKYCNAPLILFADSDLIFDKPLDLTKVVKDNKPEILYTHYDKVGDAKCWQDCTSRFMNERQEFEFMRRLPLIYHRSTLEAISAMPINLEEYILNSGRFSEFNVIGAYAFRHQREQYNFVNTDDWTYVAPMGIQLWSHADRNSGELHRVEYRKSIDSINSVLSLGISDLNEVNKLLQ